MSKVTGPSSKVGTYLPTKVVDIQLPLILVVNASFWRKTTHVIFPYFPYRLSLILFVLRLDFSGIYELLLIKYVVHICMGEREIYIHFPINKSTPVSGCLDWGSRGSFPSKATIIIVVVVPFC